MNMPSAPESIVYMPVQVAYLPLVNELIATLAKRGLPLTEPIVLGGVGVKSAPAPDVRRDATPTGTKDGRWTSDLARIAYRESDKAMRGVLGLLASNPDTPFTSKEVARAAGYPVHKLPSVLGAFGNRCKSRYKTGGACFENRYDKVARSRLYVMPASIAEAIRRDMNEG